MGLAPTGKRRLFTAHADSGPTRVDSGRTGVWEKAGVPERARNRVYRSKQVSAEVAAEPAKGGTGRQHLIGPASPRKSARFGERGDQIDGLTRCGVADKLTLPQMRAPFGRPSSPVLERTAYDILGVYTAASASDWTSAQQM